MALTFKTYRTEDIDANLRQMRICPLDVMVVGATGAGKSTTLNAFFPWIIISSAIRQKNSNSSTNPV